MSGISSKLKHLIESKTAIDFSLSNTTLEASDLDPAIKSTPTLLGTYTYEDVVESLRQYGITESLNAIGFKDLIVEMDTTDPFVHSVTVSDKALSYKQPQDRFLIQFFLRRKIMEYCDLSKHTDSDSEVKLFMRESLNWQIKITLIEWLSMQNPTESFSKERPQLPDQKHPGLKIARNVITMFEDLAKKHDRDGLLNFPEHFHNAWLYSRKNMFFLNPQVEGSFS